jgi:hypothetical protein
MTSLSDIVLDATSNRSNTEIVPPLMTHIELDQRFSERTTGTLSNVAP